MPPKWIDKLDWIGILKFLIESKFKQKIKFFVHVALLVNIIKIK